MNNYAGQTASKLAQDPQVSRDSSIQQQVQGLIDKAEMLLNGSASIADKLRMGVQNQKAGSEKAQVPPDLSCALHRLGSLLDSSLDHLNRAHESLG